MKSPALLRSLIAVTASFALFTPGTGRAADPITDAFFPPELVIKFHEQINLTGEQGATLQSAYQDTQQHIQALQQDMQRETEKLAELAKPERVDDKTVLAQADKILDIERQMKHAQLSLMILIKNTLTSDQQAKLTEMKVQIAGIEAKVNQVKAAAQKWQQEGRDLTPLQALKSEFEGAMAQGKFAEVNASLDRALKLLNGTDK